MSKCMYMSECKIFSFLLLGTPNMYKNSYTIHTVYNCTEKIAIEPFCSSLAFNEIDALKGNS